MDAHEAALLQARPQVRAKKEGPRVEDRQGVIQISKRIKDIAQYCSFMLTGYSVWLLNNRADVGAARYSGDAAYSRPARYASNRGNTPLSWEGVGFLQRRQLSRW